MADGEVKGISKNVSRFVIVVPRTLSVPPAQRHWPETTEGYAEIPVQYYIILNQRGQVKPTKFERQFQSTIATWICPRCVTKSLFAELPMAGVVNTSF